MRLLRTTFLALLSVLSLPAMAQLKQSEITVDYNNPQKYIVGGVEVEGNHYFGPDQIIQLTGLQKGLEVTVPSDDVSSIVSRLWLQRYFEDVAIVIDSIAPSRDTAFFKICITERPRVSRWTFTGVKSGEQKELLENRIDLRVCGISDLRRIVFFRSGVPLDSWRKELEVSDERSSVDSLLAYVRDEQPLNPVFVDCSMEEDDALDVSGKPGSPETEAPESAGEIAWHYPDIFSAGMNVVTLNTLANNLPYNFYLKMHKTASLNKKNFLYGSSVGAGLPVMEMLRNMVRTGDYLIRFEGITCDAFAYLFKEMEEGLSFSEAVKAAGKKGSLEGNPALILSPDVMRRNAVIIAREAGFPVELEDVEVEPLFPENFDASVAPEKFMEQLPVADEWFASKIENTGVPGTGSCAGAGGKNSVSVKVGFFEVPPDAPLADIRCAESIFVFTTRYYSPFPLVLQGYGSNTETSAAGLFADILRTASW